jgi:hypothetical protein
MEIAACADLQLRLLLIVASCSVMPVRIHLMRVLRNMFQDQAVKRNLHTEITIIHIERLMS